MKVTVLAENLKKGMSLAMKGVSSRVQLPILSCILFKASKDGLELSATDLEISLRVKVRAKVDEEGILAIPGKLFFELINTLPAGVIEIGLEKQTLSLSSETFQVQINGQGGEEFPALPQFGGKGIKIPAEALKESLHRVMVASARDESRPVLSGVLWVEKKEGVELVATDGYRLSLEKLKVKDIDSDRSFIFPIRAIMELIKILEGEKDVAMDVDQEKQQVVWLVGEVEMSSRLIAGEFPPYQKVLPTTQNTRVIFKRDLLEEAVRRASLFAKDNANVIRLEIKENQVLVLAQNDQRGSTKTALEALREGEEVDVSFNAKYLLEYLGVGNSKEVIMETEGELKPVVFKEEDTDYLHVIMPVRVNV